MRTPFSVRLVSVAFAAFFAFIVALSGSTAAYALEMRDDGIHTQAWMKQLSFLDLKEDLAEAQAKGKGLVILFEQVGCGSCKKLHEVNFADKEVVSYITEHFDVLQVNMYGDNQITDFDGEVLSEVRYNEKMLVNFSPTTLFFGADGQEAFRIPGYLSPNFYKNGFKYVVEKGPQQGILFPRWLKMNRDREQQAAQKAAN